MRLISLKRKNAETLGAVERERESNSLCKIKTSVKKVINVRLLVFVLCIVLVIFAFLNKSTIQNLIVSNANTTESEIKNLGVTDESETESWDDTIVSEIIVDTSMTDDDGDTITMYVPIPSGYTASDVEGETTVKEGLVIYEGEETVSEDEDATIGPNHAYSDNRM